MGDAASSTVRVVAPPPLLARRECIAGLDYSRLPAELEHILALEPARTYLPVAPQPDSQGAVIEPANRLHVGMVVTQNLETSNAPLKLLGNAHALGWTLCVKQHDV